MASLSHTKASGFSIGGWDALHSEPPHQLHQRLDDPHAGRRVGFDHDGFAAGIEDARQLLDRERVGRVAPVELEHDRGL